MIVEGLGTVSRELVRPNFEFSRPAGAAGLVRLQRRVSPDIPAHGARKLSAVHIFVFRRGNQRRKRCWS